MINSESVEIWQGQSKMKNENQKSKTKMKNEKSKMKNEK
jgi:hypothetical protein